MTAKLTPKLKGSFGTGFPLYIKTTTPTVTVVMILSVQERISQAHESALNFARRERGLEGNAFVWKIDAIFFRKKGSDVSLCLYVEFSARL